MIYNVIPVNYTGGSGGQFLSAFLYSALKVEPINWVFSKDGNAHDADKSHGTPPYGIGQDPTGEKNILHLVEFAKTVPENTVVYPHGHYSDPDLLMQYVNKQIKIYVEPERLDETMGVFMLKNPNTSLAFRDLTNPVVKEKYKNHYMIQWRKHAEKQFLRLYGSCPDLEPRMLNVSWNDMLYNDPEVLISKLHDFTEIPKENFNREKFAEWRTLTHKTVDRLKQAGIIT